MNHRRPNVLMPPQKQNNLMNWNNHNIYTKNDISSSSSYSPLKEFVDYSATKRDEHRQMAQLSTDGQTLMKNHALIGGMDFECIADEDLEDMLSSDLTSWLHTDKKLVTKPTESNHDHINRMCSQTWKNGFSNCEEKKKSNFPMEGKLDEIENKNHDSSQPLKDGEVSSLSDSKRERRILANRQSAQRSRVRKIQYITDLENNVATLETEVSSLSPRVAQLDRQRSMLAVSNENLKQQIASLSQEKKFKDAEHDSLREQIERLTLLHEQQIKQKMEMNKAMPVPESNTPESVKENESQKIAQLQ